ncbi:MAG: hypothetical protein WB762_31170 [Candidatus Sulfotelmatobacter sp.]
MPLAEVSNAALKKLVEAMATGGLAAKTIVNYSQVPKMVVASVVNDEGDQVYPRKWNHDFVGLPIIDKNKQHRLTVTESKVGQITSHHSFRFGVLFSLLAGSGPRIGEALALKASDFTDDFRVLHVTRSIWHGREQDPKTPAAVREVDLAESLTTLVRAFAEGKDGYLFSTRSGRPIGHRNVNRAAGVGAMHSGAFARKRFAVPEFPRN